MTSFGGNPKLEVVRIRPVHQHFQIVIAFQHHRMAPHEIFFDRRCHVANVGGVADAVDAVFRGDLNAVANRTAAIVGSGE